MPGFLRRHGLLVIGLALPMVYWLGITLPYPLSFGLTNPRATWILADQGSYAVLARQVGVYLLLTLLYVVALRVLAKKEASPLSDTLRQDKHTSTTHTSPPVRLPSKTMPILWVSWLLCSTVLLFAAPNGESHDIYDYLFRGRMMDRYAASPLHVTPDAFPDAPFYRYVAWRRNVDTYGPVWEYNSAATSAGVRLVLQTIGRFDEDTPGCPRSITSCQTLAGYVTGYRLLAVLLTAMSGLLIVSMTRGTRPASAPLALAAWLWNPLLLISTALGAHNDALMLCLILFGLWWWRRQKWAFGWLAIALATQVKLTALLFIPALGLWLARRIGWLRAMRVSVLSALLALGISWLLYIPLGGWETLPRMLYERQLFVSHSFSQILYFLLYKWSQWDWSLVWQMMVIWPTWLFLATAALLLARSYRVDNHLYRTCTLLTLLYLLVGSFWFQPWYFLWVLAPAVLWVDGAFVRRVLPWACFGALCSNIIFIHLTQMPPASEPDAHLYRLGVTLVVVSSIWLPLWIAQIITSPPVNG